MLRSICSYFDLNIDSLPGERKASYVNFSFNRGSCKIVFLPELIRYNVDVKEPLQPLPHWLNYPPPFYSSSSPA